MLTVKKQAVGSTTELKTLIYRSDDEKGRRLNIGENRPYKNLLSSMLHSRTTSTRNAIFIHALNFKLNLAAALAYLAPVNAFKCCLTVDRKLSLSTNTMIYIPKFLYRYCFLFVLVFYFRRH